MFLRPLRLLAPLALIASLPACAPTSLPATRIPAPPPTIEAAPATAGEAPLTPSPTASPQPVDYAPMIQAIDDHLKASGYGAQFDMAVGFVDLQTGQTASFDGDARHLSLSTFKGPLGAYYLWLIERHALEPQPGDEALLQAMMDESDNGSTSCVFKRVGGLAGFNDWLAEQGLSRQNNFVARWENMGCAENGQTTLLPIDPRYDWQGDRALGLPGDYALQVCEPDNQPCAEAFAPVELAGLYARLYRGEALNEANTRAWLAWMGKKREAIALIGGLPAGAPARAFVKNGFDAADDTYPLNYYHEAGIVETPHGVYALAVFTQGYPDWPATQPVKAVGAIVYSFFIDAHQARQ